MVEKYRFALMREKILSREISVLAEEDGNLRKAISNIKWIRNRVNRWNDLNSFRKQPKVEIGSVPGEVVDAPMCGVKNEKFPNSQRPISDGY